MKQLAPLLMLVLEVVVDKLLLDRLLKQQKALALEPVLSRTILLRLLTLLLVPHKVRTLGMYMLTSAGGAPPGTASESTASSATGDIPATDDTPATDAAG